MAGPCSTCGRDGKMRIKFESENQEERDPLEVLDIDGKIISKLI